MLKFNYATKRIGVHNFFEDTTCTRLYKIEIITNINGKPLLFEKLKYKRVLKPLNGGNLLVDRDSGRPKSDFFFFPFFLFSGSAALRMWTFFCFFYSHFFQSCCRTSYFFFLFGSPVQLLLLVTVA